MDSDTDSRYRKHIGTRYRNSDTRSEDRRSHGRPHTGVGSGFMKPDFAKSRRLLKMADPFRSTLVQTKGVKGQKGEVGELGLPGPEGPRGFTGPQGQTGESPFLHRSAFSMGLTTKVSTPNVPIRFTKVFYNEQRHYDETTGKFTCHVKGLYLFSYHLTVYMKDVKIGLYKNNKPIMFTFDQFQTNNVDQASGSVLLALVVGDEVCLQIYGEDYGGIYGDNLNDSSFSGILLYPSSENM
ncbi:unnamed protein product [Ranitomeya imitator]|uniref:C1q domain-containing protein n=1 Tax=Ranitomeya imitator TaxID=111125 RepID=A0ABN9L6Q0_9NEOB|nr:unnamed protein product [Ranitomeya imitator]